MSSKSRYEVRPPSLPPSLPPSIPTPVSCARSCVCLEQMATPERTGGDERARERAGHQYPQLYAPKALVLLSHYPFYNLYTQFLQQVRALCRALRGAQLYRWGADTW